MVGDPMQSRPVKENRDNHFWMKKRKDGKYVSLIDLDNGTPAKNLLRYRVVYSITYIYLLDDV